MLKPGWLNRQIQSVYKEIAHRPSWVGSLPERQCMNGREVRKDAAMTPEDMVRFIQERGLNVEFYGPSGRHTCLIFEEDGDIWRGDGEGLVAAFEAAIDEFIGSRLNE